MPTEGLLDIQIMYRVKLRHMSSRFKNMQFIVPKFYLFIEYNLQSISSYVLGHLEVGGPRLIMKYSWIDINTYRKLKVLR